MTISIPTYQVTVNSTLQTPFQQLTSVSLDKKSVVLWNAHHTDQTVDLQQIGMCSYQPQNLF